MIVDLLRLSLTKNQASLVLHYKIKALQNLISNLFCLAFQIALKRKVPVTTDLPQTLSLQIDSRLPQVVTHQKSGKSDVALQNKIPPKSHIKGVLLGISDSSKKESPSYHRLVSLQIDSRPSQVVTHPKSGKSEVALQNKSPQKMTKSIPSVKPPSTLTIPFGLLILCIT